MAGLDVESARTLAFLLEPNAGGAASAEPEGADRYRAMRRLLLAEKCMQRKLRRDIPQYCALRSFLLQSKQQKTGPYKGDAKSKRNILGDLSRAAADDVADAGKDQFMVEEQDLGRSRQAGEAGSGEEGGLAAEVREGEAVEKRAAGRLLEEGVEGGSRDGHCGRREEAGDGDESRRLEPEALGQGEGSSERKGEGEGEGAESEAKDESGSSSISSISMGEGGGRSLEDDVALARTGMAEEEEEDSGAAKEADVAARDRPNGGDGGRARNEEQLSSREEEEEEEEVGGEEVEEEVEEEEDAVEEAGAGANLDGGRSGLHQEEAEGNTIDASSSDMDSGAAAAAERSEGGSKKETHEGDSEDQAGLPAGAIRSVRPEASTKVLFGHAQGEPPHQQAPGQQPQETVTATGGSSAVSSGLSQQRELVRMVAVFEDCKASVHRLKFARSDPSLLAFAATDGTFRICSVGETSFVKHELAGHTKAVSDFDWSSDDDYLCSSSLDKSVRVWAAATGQCLRIIYTQIAQTGIRFHPANNNFLIVANAQKELTVMNFSTGRAIHKLKLEHNIAELEADKTGIIFVADTESTIHSITVDQLSGQLHRHHSNSAGVHHKAATASLHFKLDSQLAHTPVLLACNKEGSVRFYGVALELQGYLFLKCALQLSSRGANMKAAFSPSFAPSGRSGEYIVTGNSDHHVYFYDFMQPKHPFVAKQLGHKAMVMDVCWNEDGKFLASSDSTGVVIIWKRL